MLGLLIAFQLLVILFYLTVYISLRKILSQIESLNSQIQSSISKSSKRPAGSDNVHKSLIVERVSMAEL